MHHRPVWYHVKLLVQHVKQCRHNKEATVRIGAGSWRAPNFEGYPLIIWRARTPSWDWGTPNTLQKNHLLTWVTMLRFIAVDQTVRAQVWKSAGKAVRRITSSCDVQCAQ